MATCPYCHTDKPMVAPVCHSCNTDTPFLFQVGISLLTSVLTIACYIGVWWVIFAIVL